jgi:glycosyltransferase involved in cell wall biosynthesis
MRVTHVAPTMFGSEGLFGGGERYPLELARALAEHVDCRLVTFGPHERRWTESNGLEVVVLKTLFHLKRHPAHPVAAKLFDATAGADIVHSHHMRSAPSRLAAVVARARRQRIVVTDHGLGGGGWGGLLPRIFHRFLTVSDFSAQTLNAPPERTTVIYGGADPNRFHPATGESRAGVLFVGRLTPHKGIDVLLRALPDNAHLTLAGTPGHDRRTSERHYPELIAHLAKSKDVRFAGRIDEHELPQLHRHAVVFVLPSLHETCYGRHIPIPELLGLSVLEAMASGTPVVCSRVGGVPEIVDDGITGFLVEPGNVGELNDRIQQLLSNRKLAEKMGRAGRDRVLDRFTWEHCAARCLAAYDELTSGGPEYPPKATGDSQARTDSDSTPSASRSRDSSE